MSREDKRPLVDVVVMWLWQRARLEEAVGRSHTAEFRWSSRNPALGQKSAKCSWEHGSVVKALAVQTRGLEFTSPEPTQISGGCDAPPVIFQSKLAGLTRKEALPQKNKVEEQLRKIVHIIPEPSHAHAHICACEHAHCIHKWMKRDSWK